MARDDSPPFERGTTWYGGATIDTTDLGGVSLEGKEWVFEDVDQSVTGGRALRSGKKVRVRVVRNTSGVTLFGKRLVSFLANASTGDKYNARVDGNVNVTAARGYPADEWLPSGGVVANDLFYVVVEGPAMCLTDTNTLGGTINVGDQVVAGTFATSTSSTGGGRVQFQDLTGATQNLANQIRHAIGRALSAMTANNTSSDILIDVGKW